MSTIPLIALLTALLSPSDAYMIYGGMETYHFDRFRDGGTCQEGRVDGVRVGIERIRDWSWYFGADYLYAKGHLTGETSTGRPLNSELTDSIFEARLGITLTQPGCRCPRFTPYAGWGTFREENDFSPPSPLPCTFTDTFNYLAVGFLSGVNITPLLSMGFNFKVRFMYDGESRISNDPKLENVTLMMEDETQYRVEVPVNFKPCSTLCGVGFELLPFYEFRHFGGREGYPFNFRDTKFHLYGARIALTKDF